jgi:hypothetical protein
MDIPFLVIEARHYLLSKNDTIRFDYDTKGGYKSIELIVDSFKQLNGVYTSVINPINLV